MAAHFYHTTWPDSDISELKGDDRARVVTVERRSDKDPSHPGEICVKDPCGVRWGGPQGSDQSQFMKYGCVYFNQAENWQTIYPDEDDEEMCKDREVSDARPESTRGYTFHVTPAADVHRLARRYFPSAVEDSGLVEAI